MIELTVLRGEAGSGRDPRGLGPNRNPGWGVLLTGLALMTVSGCGSSQEKPAPPTEIRQIPVVMVTNEVLRAFVEAAAGSSVNTEIPLPPGKTARHWKPLRKSVQAMQQSSLILFSGAGYEPWVDRLSLPPSRTRITSESYREQLIEIPDAVVHQHGPSGSHSHPGLVWATWLDPDLAMAQFDAVTQALAAVVPDPGGHPESLQTLKRELNQLNDVLQQVSARTGNQNLRVLADGPQYSYLTRRLGWTLDYLHWDEDPVLSQVERSELQTRLNQAPPSGKLIFLMANPLSDDDRRLLEAQRLLPVVLDLCEQPATEPLAARLRQNLNTLLRTTEQLSP